MRRIYIIGNGKIPFSQKVYLIENRCTCFQLNKASMDFDSDILWGSSSDQAIMNRLPTFYGSFEQQAHIRKWMKNDWMREAIKPKWDGIRKFFPDFAKNRLDYLPNAIFLPSITWEDYKAGRTGHKGGFIRLGSSGAIAAYLSLSKLKYNIVTLVGCDAIYDEHKATERQQRAWNRLATIIKGMYQRVVLNASEVPGIPHVIPRITLGDEMNQTSWEHLTRGKWK